MSYYQSFTDYESTIHLVGSKLSKSEARSSGLEFRTRNLTHSFKQAYALKGCPVTGI